LGSRSPRSGSAGSGGTEAGSKPRVHLWPILITLGLVFVILVNAVFIYIAVSGADEVVPSYHTEER
jgi:hypothetical protein